MKRFVLFLLRVVALPQLITLPPSIRDILCNKAPSLIRNTNHHNSPQCLGLVRELLLQLWTTTWPVSQADSFPDPTLRFIIHTQARPDGSIALPHQATPLFSKFFYMMVCVV